MKNVTALRILLLFIILSTALSYGQDFSNLTLIAHYPLSATANDTTGNYGPLVLTNTPFQEGALYCNGNYIGTEPDSCNMYTPDISALNMKKFAISAMFKVDSITTTRRPVLVGGRFYKWCTLFIDPDSTVGLAQDGYFGTSSSSGVHYSSNTWHTIAFTYDSTEGMGRIYFDGAVVDSSTRVIDHRDDRAFSITNGSVSRTFQGYLKDVKIYSYEAPLTDLQKDSLALVALYNSTDGGNWTNRDNWLSGPLDTWHGVIMDGDRVGQINLEYNNLNGPIPAGFCALTGLTSARLAFNQLSGSLPPEIGNLVNLAYLELFANQLTGPIPKEIGTMAELTYLILTDNQFAGTLPSQIGNLPKAAFIDISNNQFTGAVPAEIGNLAQLVELSLQDNQLDSLPNLTVASSLVKLHVYENKFTFEDLEPNIGIADFSYVPQEDVGEADDTTVTAGDGIIFSVQVGGTANQYQWYKGQTSINGATGASYEIGSVASADAGYYSCRITNSVVTGLTISSREIRLQVTPAVEVKDEISAVPVEFTLHQNYPNPFNPTTLIKYDLSKKSDVEIAVYNITGDRVKNIVFSSRAAGNYEFTWNGKNQNGQLQPSGIYLCRVTAGQFSGTIRMLLLK